MICKTIVEEKYMKKDMQNNMLYKIAIVSDTHGNWEKAVEEIQKESKITHFVFLGDHAADGTAIAQVLGVPSYIVCGNCDATLDGVGEQIFSLGEWQFLICHGHQYFVKDTVQFLVQEAENRGVDFALYGHTHVAVYEPDIVTLINPGSLSTVNFLMKNASWGLLTLPAEKNEKNLVKYEKKTCQT